ncbi:uncharacterized protein BYT42DRAFT_171090 [Radiomyces spectabilis]|uniref:uncharacterized protein n=1 Tax=Radiomyces spectabilis TaxID=64574 RepID=UPI0022207E86|nr:uncharacterized protein BYT42DRAFT_171090 [Radiomyces spectabilis]KAI8390817.1 hypothetical protein BYT42DRAFT_171090 [Radiomyces spectabilis]
MPRIRPVLFGVIVASAITYKCRDDLLRDTQSISHRLNEAKSRLDQAASRSYLEAKRARSSYMDNVPILADSQRYVSKELVPSGKVVLLVLI